MGSHIPGAGDRVKTTVELSEALFRRAKAEAALRGRKFKDLFELLENGALRVGFQLEEQVPALR